MKGVNRLEFCQQKDKQDGTGRDGMVGNLTQIAASYLFFGTGL